MILFHAPTFSNKTCLFQIHVFKQEATSAFTRSSLWPIATDLVWPRGTDAAVALLRSPPLMDAFANPRTDLVWFYIPSTSCSSKFLCLQNETILKPYHHRHRGSAGKTPVHPKDSACIPLKCALEFALQTVTPYIPMQLQVSGQIQELWTRPVSNGGDCPTLKRPCFWYLPQRGQETPDVLAAAGCLVLGELGLEESSQPPPNGAGSPELSGRLHKEVW